jgi:hypothetical protein
MADQDRPSAGQDAEFETGVVRASRAREQGLGVGERELAAQRDPGGVRTPDVEPGSEEEDRGGPFEAVEQSLGVQGAREDAQVDPAAGGASKGA